MIEKNGEAVFICPVCPHDGRRMMLLCDLREHIAEKHLDNYHNYSCPNCKENFVTALKAHRHIRDVCKIQGYIEMQEYTQALLSYDITYVERMHKLESAAIFKYVAACLRGKEDMFKPVSTGAQTSIETRTIASQTMGKLKTSSSAHSTPRRETRQIRVKEVPTPSIIEASVHKEEKAPANFFTVLSTSAVPENFNQFETNMTGNFESFEPKEEIQSDVASQASSCEISNLENYVVEKKEITENGDHVDASTSTDVNLEADKENVDAEMMDKTNEANVNKDLDLSSDLPTQSSVNGISNMDISNVKETETSTSTIGVPHELKDSDDEPMANYANNKDLGEKVDLYSDLPPQTFVGIGMNFDNNEAQREEITENANKMENTPATNEQFDVDTFIEKHNIRKILEDHDYLCHDPPSDENLNLDKNQTQEDQNEMDPLVPEEETPCANSLLEDHDSVATEEPTTENLPSSSEEKLDETDTVETNQNSTLDNLREKEPADLEHDKYVEQMVNEFCDALNKSIDESEKPITHYSGIDSSSVTSHSRAECLSHSDASSIGTRHLEDTDLNTSIINVKSEPVGPDGEDEYLDSASPKGARDFEQEMAEEDTKVNIFVEEEGPCFHLRGLKQEIPSEQDQIPDVKPVFFGTRIPEAEISNENQCEMGFSDLEEVDCDESSEGFRSRKGSRKAMEKISPRIEKILPAERKRKYHVEDYDATTSKRSDYPAKKRRSGENEKKTEKKIIEGSNYKRIVRSYHVCEYISCCVPKSKDECIFCRGGHRSEDCASFSTLEDRKQQAFILSLCKRCGSGHKMKPSCEGVKCSMCGRKGHHGAFCFSNESIKHMGDVQNCFFGRWLPSVTELEKIKEERIKNEKRRLQEEAKKWSSGRKRDLGN